MHRLSLLGTVLLVSGCSEFQFVSTAGPVPGDEPVDWTDPQSPPDGSTPQDEPQAPPSSGMPASVPIGIGDDPEAEPPADDSLDDPEDGDALETDGCTPGYWKQEQHFASWPAGLTPDTLFLDVFGYDAFPGLTLLDVLGLGEGDLDALGRHSVAAYLSSLADGVDYPLTDVEVLDAFADAYESGSYADTKGTFETYNEANCPLS